jgi:polysaccharide biosynthesis protein PslH
MRILWLKSELLHPVDKGGRIRTYQMLRELKRTCKVTYLTLDDGSAAPDAVELSKEYADELIRIPHRGSRKFSPKFYLDLGANIFSPLPYAAAKYRSAAMERRIAEEAVSGRHDLVVCDFLAPAVNFPRKLPIPAVLFQHNVEAMIWRRHYETAPDGLKRVYFREQWHRMHDLEKEQCRRFDKVIAVSRDDAETMEREYGVAGVADVPTGVDTQYFSPSGAIEKSPSEIVFTGSMDWLPNDDAIRWFAGEILPKVSAAVPEATLTIVGRDPLPAVRTLGDEDPAITVTGRVEDVRPFLERAGVFVVPIRIGGGTRLKIFEAMAMGLPVVSTTIGAEGLPLESGNEIIIRDDPAEFAAAVAGLLRDREQAEELGSRGQRAVRERFGWKAAAERFQEICGGVSGGVSAKRAEAMAS